MYHFVDGKNGQGKQAGPAERNDSRRGDREARASQLTSPPVVHSIGLCHDWRWLLALKSKTLEKTPSPEKCLFLFFLFFLIGKDIVQFEDVKILTLVASASGTNSLDTCSCTYAKCW